MWMILYIAYSVRACIQLMLIDTASSECFVYNQAGVPARLQFPSLYCYLLKQVELGKVRGYVMICGQ